MRQDLTDVTLIVDRSGSMTSCQKEAEGGLNAFIKEQKKLDGEITFTLLQFDTEMEYVCNGINIKKAKRFHLEPRGMTALLDAVGMAIDDTGKRLSEMSEDDRPARVIVAIITDGQENSSSRFTRDQIRRMIEHQQNIYSWQFTFLGANQDSFAEAGSIGIRTDATANYNMHNSKATFQVLSNNISRIHSGGMSGQSVGCYYTDEEKMSMLMGEDKKRRSVKS